jgi:hypothetical protein
MNKIISKWHLAHTTMICHHCAISDNQQNMTTEVMECQDLFKIDARNV